MVTRQAKLNRRQFHSAVIAGTTIINVGTPNRIVAENKSEIRAGAAELVTTPNAEGTFLIGPMKPSTGVNDDLYVRALIISAGEKRIAIITLDYLGFDFEFTKKLIAAASKAAGIPTHHIMLNCSHTHNAPLTAPWGPWKKYQDQPFHKLLLKRIREVVQKANEQLQPAHFFYGRESTQIGFNRRLFNGEKIVMAPNPKGAVIPWVDVLSIVGVDGKQIAVLFSYAAHPVIVHQASTLISADYPGFAIEHLKQSLGNQAIYLFAQGCSGNINGFPLQGGIDAAKAAGRDLGQAVIRAINSMDQLKSFEQIRVKSSETSLPLQSPPTVEQCQQLLKQEQQADKKEAYAELLAIAKSEEPQSIQMPIRAFAFGDFCLLGMAHEPFAEYHHYVDKISPFKQNMVLGYTNGLKCYVGTKKDYNLGKQGGYETSPQGAALKFQSRLPLDASCEQLIHKSLYKLIKSF